MNTRKVLQKGGGGEQIADLPDIALHTQGEALWLEVSPDALVDARELSDVVHLASADGRISEDLAARLQRALDACDAPFMDGMVEDWTLAERERLYNLQLRGLTILMHWHGESIRYEDALEVGRRLLEAL